MLSARETLQERRDTVMLTRQAVATASFGFWACSLGLLVMTVFGAFEAFDLELLMASLAALPVATAVFTLARLEATPRRPGWLLVVSAGAQLLVLFPLVILLFLQSRDETLMLLTLSILVGATICAGIICCAVLAGDTFRSQVGSLGPRLVSAIPLVLVLSFAVAESAAFYARRNDPIALDNGSWLWRPIAVGAATLVVGAVISLVAVSRREANISALGTVALVQLATLFSTASYSLLLAALSRAN